MTLCDSLCGTAHDVELPGVAEREGEALPECVAADVRVVRGRRMRLRVLQPLGQLPLLHLAAHREQEFQFHSKFKHRVHTREWLVAYA